MRSLEGSPGDRLIDLSQAFENSISLISDVTSHGEKLHFNISFIVVGVKLEEV